MQHSLMYYNMVTLCFNFGVIDFWQFVKEKNNFFFVNQVNIKKAYTTIFPMEVLLPKENLH